MRKIVGVAAIVALLACGVVALGRPETESRVPMEVTLVELGLTLLEEAPEGIEPLELSSLRQLEGFLSSKRSQHKAPGRVDDEGSDRTVSTTSTIITIEALHWSYICNPVWRTRFNLYADFYIASYGPYYWIDDVRNVRVSLSGFHPFMRLINTYTDAYIYQSNQRARVEGGGTLEYYLFIQGILAYYSEPAWIVAYYSP